MYDTNITYGYKENGLIVAKISIDTPDILNSIDYIKIGDKKYKTLVNSIGEISLDKENLINYQEVYLKFNNDLKENQVFKLTIMYNKEKVYKNFKTIIELNNSNTENAHSICSRLLYAVLFDIASCIEGNPNNDKANLIKPCIDYIKSNYMHDISISALAEMIKVTPTYLGIIFKKVYNITPQKFLTNIRIENSKQLLVSNKNMSLSDVAINSGFNSESYFCNTFKKYIGITPTEYRSINTFGEI